MKTSDKINYLIDLGLQKANKKEHSREYLGASYLGYPCSRRIQYMWKNVSRAEKRELSGHKLRIFSIGDKYEELAEPSFTESERKIFNEFREKIGKLSSDTWYGNGRKPQYKVKFQNNGGGERDIIELKPDGNLEIIFDNLLAYE